MAAAVPARSKSTPPAQRRHPASRAHAPAIARATTRTARTSTSARTANQNCYNAPGAYTCSCQGGFEADGTADLYGKVDCVDIDECATGEAACVEHATCANKPGSYQCGCDEGYIGNANELCVPTSDCPCDEEHQVCLYGTGIISGQCHCAQGYEIDTSVTDKLVCIESNAFGSVGSLPESGGCATQPNGRRNGGWLVALVGLALVAGRRRWRT